jgi:hypothetical protein
VLESEYTTLVIGSEYTLFMNPESVLDIHHYSLLYIPCWPNKPSTCVRVDHTSEREREGIFFTILPLPSPKNVCLVSCSLETFWVCYLILKCPEKNIKKYSKKRNKKTRDDIEGALCVFSFLMGGGTL